MAKTWAVTINFIQESHLKQLILILISKQNNQSTCGGTTGSIFYINDRSFVLESPFSNEQQVFVAQTGIL